MRDAETLAKVALEYWSVGVIALGSLGESVSGLKHIDGLTRLKKR